MHYSDSDAAASLLYMHSKPELIYLSAYTDRAACDNVESAGPDISWTLLHHPIRACHFVKTNCVSVSVFVLFYSLVCSGGCSPVGCSYLTSAWLGRGLWWWCMVQPPKGWWEHQIKSLRSLPLKKSTTEGQDRMAVSPLGLGQGRSAIHSRGISAEQRLSNHSLATILGTAGVETVCMGLH